MKKVLMIFAIALAGALAFAAIKWYSGFEKKSEPLTERTEKSQVNDEVKLTEHPVINSDESNESYNVAFYRDQQLFTASVADGKIQTIKEETEEVKVNSSNYYTKSLMPKEVITSIPISDGMTFYSALKSQAENNTWVFVERNMKNTSYNFCRFNQTNTTKKILFTQESSPDKKYAFKPIAWSNDRDIIYLEALVFGSSTEHEGVWSYNLATGSAQKINVNPNYVQTPSISPDYRYFAYCATDGKKDLHSPSRQILLYDLETNKEMLLQQDNQSTFSILGWIAK